MRIDPFSTGVQPHGSQPNLDDARAEAIEMILGVPGENLYTVLDHAHFGRRAGSRTIRFHVPEFQAGAVAGHEGFLDRGPAVAFPVPHQILPGNSSIAA